MQENPHHQMSDDHSAPAEINLLQSIDRLRSEDTWREKERHSLVLFKSDTLRLVLVGMHEGAEIHTHSAIGAITVQVLKGKMNFAAEGKTVELSEGGLVSLAARVPHSVTATKETFFLLTLVLRS